MKGKTQKGITLVALVITVVVLLILAGVAISTINETGIIAKSNNAATKFNASQAGESENLVGYEDIIGKYDGSGNTETVTLAAGTYKGNDTIDCRTVLDQSITFVWNGNTYTRMFTSYDANYGWGTLAVGNGAYCIWDDNYGGYVNARSRFN